MTVQPDLTGKLTGYSATDNYIAQKSEQGGRKHYLIVLPLPQVVTTLPIPDPNVPFDDNREVNTSHAKSFAEYVKTHSHWHAGCLTIRTLSGATEFEPFPGAQVGNLQFGTLKVPRNARGIFKIIDGQHRILGIKYLLDSLSDDLMTATSSLAKAQRIGADKAVVEQFERQIRNIKEIQKRVESDSIGIELVVEDDTELAKQIFVDVANHALGVRKAITAVFDQTKVVHRALNELLDGNNVDDLIVGRIDVYKDRVTGSNTNIMGAGSLADIIRTLTVGINGRVVAAQEKTLDQKQLARETNTFFEVLRHSFPELDDIAIGKRTPADIRKTSILGSSTMLRILAGVYYSLRTDGASLTDVQTFFKKLASHTTAPVTSSTASGRMWLNATTEGAFADGANAPGSRAQAVKALVNAIVDWYKNPPAELV
jgi:hypothetical protein